MLFLPRYLRHVLLRQASRTATSESLGACRLQLACFSSVMLGDRQFFLVLVANFLQTAIADVLKQYLAHWTRGIEIFCQQLVAHVTKDVTLATLPYIACINCVHVQRMSAYHDSMRLCLYI